MKYPHKAEDGSIAPLSFVLVAVIVIIIGVAFYQSTKPQAANSGAKSSPSASPATTASPTATPAPTPTDQALITAAVRANLQSGGQHPVAGTKIILSNLQGDDALVNIGGAGPGGFDLLKKNQGTWSVVFSGQNIDPTTETQLGFSQGFSNSGSSATSTVLYTY